MLTPYLAQEPYLVPPSMPLVVSSEVGCPRVGGFLDAKRKETTKQIWQLWKKLEQQYPKAHSHAILAMMLQRSPAVRYAFRDLTTSDYSRDGALATLRGGLERIHGDVE